MPEVAKKKRIFQIAKELNISHMEIIQFLKNNGTVVESHMAPVTPEAYDEILLEFSKDKLQIERHRKEQARKIVVSKIHKKEVEDPNASIISEKPAIRKLKTSIEDCQDILKKLEGMEEESLPSWWTDKITLASNYLNKARDYLLNTDET